MSHSSIWNNSLQNTTCADCRATVPTAEAFSVEQVNYCRPCLETRLKDEDRGGIHPESITACIDQTICYECKSDFGETTLEEIGGLPFCPNCTALLRNRPFPRWLKISAAVFAAVTVFAFAYNWRFFMAYVETLRANRAFDEQRISDGINLMISAGERTPEIPELFFYSNFFKAQLAISESPDHALELLNEIRLIVPPAAEKQFNEIMFHAEMSQAFDNKNYDLFLKKAKDLEALNPDDPVSLSSVASALACKYAVTGDEPYRKQSLERLERAHQAAEAVGDKSFEEYENRILHRLASREILNREEFTEKFPNGWQEPN